ncbi:hypothetical protein [uncultured Roseobacter sp.]|uniref:hypothetical protein n=1 Tax=uncultured Roseobacter sp. TaxID=114847 RepID=UPI00260D1063|nr:hypothetical protein [uncultured Roseobacter sp.]
MSDNEKPPLNRGSLGSVTVLDEMAIARILDALAFPLVPNFSEEEFARFLNDAAQFALDASFSTRPTRKEMESYKATVRRLIELTRDFNRRGVPAPMPSNGWRDQADRFGEDWTRPKRARHGYALNDPQFAGSLLGLFHAATGLELKTTTSENIGGSDGPLARFVLAVLQEIKRFADEHVFDDASVDLDRLGRFTLLPESSALRKQLAKARDETNWEERASTYQLWAKSTENS